MQIEKAQHLHAMICVLIPTSKISASRRPSLGVSAAAPQALQALVARATTEQQDRHSRVAQLLAEQSAENAAASDVLSGAAAALRDQLAAASAAAAAALEHCANEGGCHIQVCGVAGDLQRCERFDDLCDSTTAQFLSWQNQMSVKKHVLSS